MSKHRIRSLSQPEKEAIAEATVSYMFRQTQYLASIKNPDLSAVSKDVEALEKSIVLIIEKYLKLQNHG